MTANTITKVSIAAGAAIAAYLVVGAIFAHADQSPVITSSIRDNSDVNTIVTTDVLGHSVVDVTQVSSSTNSTVPTGTVDFSVFPGTACSGTAVVQSGVSLVGGFATSSATSTLAGGLSIMAHYNGDGNNVAASGPCEPLTVSSNSVTIGTTLSSNTITAGASVHDSATLSGETGDASGSVTYSIFSDNACNTPFGGAGNATVTNGAVANSGDQQFNTPGTYYWQAVYHGDAKNNAATSTCGSEILTVQATQTNSPTISTTLSNTSVTAGASVHDSATLGGQTGTAGGSVSYKVYSDNACNTLFGNAGTQTVTNGSVLDSAPFTFNSAGTYYWQAVYGGDASNNMATSTCGSEVLTVSPANTLSSPTITTSLSTTSSTVLTGSTIHDSATLSGETGSAAGTVNYNIYTNNTCSAFYGAAASGAVTDGSVANSGDFTFNSPGTYYWQAVYNGDANNNIATSSCGSEVLTVVNPGTVVTPPTQNGTLSGEVFNDANDNGAMDSGEGGLAGFTVHLYNSTNFNGFTYDPVSQTAVTDANGNYSFTGLADGTYSVEQVLKNGWKQTTDDYTSVTISGGNGQSGLNFGDVVGPKGKEHGHGTEKHNHKGNNGNGNGNNGNGQGKTDNDGDKDDTASSTQNDDNASSTHQWTFNVNMGGSQDNGLHLGWNIGKGNQDKGKKGGK